MHAVLVSHLVGPTGHVYAFEPNAALVPALTHTVNAMENGTLYAVALSDRTGEAQLFVTTEDHRMTSLTYWTEGRFIANPVLCKLNTLDILVEVEKLPLPNFIKCDVEGAELDVFRGALKTLDRVDAPLILFEANVYTARGFGHSISAALDFLAGLTQPEYHFFQADSKTHRMEELEEPDPVHSNILAVPRLHLGRLAG
jgi:FkbM family methyltransferase